MHLFVRLYETRWESEREGSREVKTKSNLKDRDSLRNLCTRVASGNGSNTLLVVSGRSSNDLFIMYFTEYTE